jgi:hypothetical protein
MSEMYGLLCGTSVSPGIIHTLDRTVQAVDKLEKTVADFVASTVAQLSGQGAKLDKIGDIVARHDTQLVNDARQRSSLFSHFVRSIIEGAIRGAMQAIILLLGVAAFLYKVHIPALH